MSLSSQEIPRNRKSRWSCRLNYETRGILLAEVVGTALLVLLSCLPACAGADPPMRAVAAGLAVALLVQCFDHISGAMLNPTVLLAAVTARKVPLGRGLGMFVAQLLGAVAGGGLLEFVAPPSPIQPAVNCLTLPVEGLPVYKALCIEGILGGLLALANMASWDARNRLLSDSWPLRIGLSVAGLSIITGTVTGASMNPARSFAPALWSGNWNHHWVYWLGPLSGSLACTLLYRSVWAPPAGALPPARAAPDAPAPPTGGKRRSRVSIEHAVDSDPDSNRINYSA